MYRLAINLRDLSAVGPALRKRLFGGKFNAADRNALIPMQAWGGEAGEIALGFLPDVPLLTAALGLDMLRSEQRRSNEACSRVYLLNGVEWRVLEESAILTVLVDGHAILNPDVFH